jgi:phospholipase C
VEIDRGPKHYSRYGFRVPTVFVSPYARPGHLSSETYDHTSILKLIERKWNLPPLTLRDAAASDPLEDMLDLGARPPPFLVAPTLSSPRAAWTDVVAARAGCRPACRKFRPPVYPSTR